MSRESGVSLEELRGDILVQPYTSDSEFRALTLMAQRLGRSNDGIDWRSKPTFLDLAQNAVFTAAIPFREAPFPLKAEPSPIYFPDT